MLCCGHGSIERLLRGITYEKEENTVALNAKILEPTDFTGAWYRTEDGMLYIFEDGIIECADKEIIVLDNAVFSGAYCFAKDNTVFLETPRYRKPRS